MRFCAQRRQPHKSAAMNSVRRIHCQCHRRRRRRRRCRGCSSCSCAAPAAATVHKRARTWADERAKLKRIGPVPGRQPAGQRRTASLLCARANRFRAQRARTGGRRGAPVERAACSQAANWHGAARGGRRRARVDVGGGGAAAWLCSKSPLLLLLLLCWMVMLSVQATFIGLPTLPCAALPCAAWEAARLDLMVRFCRSHARTKAHQRQQQQQQPLA